MDEYLIFSILAVIGSYIIGSIPSAYILSKLVKGTDITTYGTKNVGASNVSNLINKKWATPVVLFDVFIKGTLTVVLASDKVLGIGVWGEVSVGLACIVGHNWSFMIKFKGGRGVATFLGVLLAINFVLLILYMLIALFTWIVTKRRDAAIAWSIAITSLPIISLVIWLLDTYTSITKLLYVFTGDTVSSIINTNIGLPILVLTSAFFIIACIKRLTSGTSIFSNTITTQHSRRQLIFNRLVFDRDIKDKEEWLHRSKS